MSNSSQHAMFFKEEVTFGTNPGGNAVEIRTTGTTLAVTKTTHLSEELRADRQITDFRHGQKQVAGDINFELSKASHDDLLEAALCGTWGDKHAEHVIPNGDFSVNLGDNSFNDAGGTFPVYEAGDRVDVQGYGSFTIVSRTTSKIVVTPTIPGIPGPVGDVTVSSESKRLKAGTTRRSFSVERHFSDLTVFEKAYHLFTGIEINTLSMTFPMDGIVTGTFSVVGKSLATPSDTPGLTQQPSPGAGNSVMDTLSGFCKEGGTTLGFATEVTFTLENGLEPRFAIGSAEVFDSAAIGRSNCTGQLTAYFENADLLSKFLNETNSSLSIKATDPTGNSYVFTFPKILFNGGQPDTQGQGSISLSMPFQAVMDPTTSTNIIVDYHPYQPAQP